MKEITKSYLKELTYEINGAAIEVHKTLGPGLLEKAYHECLKHEFQIRGIHFLSEMIVPINYKGITIETRLRCDFFVEEQLVVELKAVEGIKPLFGAQLLTYMKLLGVSKGVLYNFNVSNLYNDGQKTYVNESYRDLKE